MACPAVKKSHYWKLIMAHNEAYRKAEQKIKEALSLGLTKLDLSAERSLDENAPALTELPDELSELTQLETLNLYGNKLTGLPKWFVNFKHLSSLNIRANKLTVLPEWLGQLSRLRSLEISQNQLTVLPKSLERLSQLQDLHFWENSLTELPEWLGQLTELRVLSLRNNQVSVLPNSFIHLQHLQKLIIHNNRLKALPEFISQLKNLRELIVSNNQLTYLPESIQDLRQLSHLFIHGNPGLGLPEESLGPTVTEVYGADEQQLTPPKSPKEILDYYFSTRGDKGVALREMKLIVVGWGKAGKTTLVKRLTGAPMDLTESETHGILISPFTLHCKDGNLSARVWDFGGQHVLHAMHEFFLTARSLYLLVVEQRGDGAERDAKYWLQLIRSYAPNAPVVVALNKSRCVERPIDKESLEKMYGPIVGWVATECLPEADCPGADASIQNLGAALTAGAEEKHMPEPRKLFTRIPQDF